MLQSPSSFDRGLCCCALTNVQVSSNKLAVVRLTALYCNLPCQTRRKLTDIQEDLRYSNAHLVEAILTWNRHHRARPIYGAKRWAERCAARLAAMMRHLVHGRRHNAKWVDAFGLRELDGQPSGEPSLDMGLACTLEDNLQIEPSETKCDIIVSTSVSVGHTVKLPS